MYYIKRTLCANYYLLNSSKHKKCFTLTDRFLVTNPLYQPERFIIYSIRFIDNNYWKIVSTNHNIVRESERCLQFRDVTRTDYLHANCKLLKYYIENKNRYVNNSRCIVLKKDSPTPYFFVFVGVHMSAAAKDFKLQFLSTHICNFILFKTEQVFCRSSSEDEPMFCLFTSKSIISCLFTFHFHRYHQHGVESPT